MLPKLLLIGAGQLGSRYLQGLIALEDQLAISVVDPSEASLAVARERLSEVVSAEAHMVEFSSSLGDALQEIDLALVVTPAHCRAKVVGEIANQYQVKAWILEKVLAQSTQQLDQIEQALAGKGRAWVNTARRTMSWHREIKSQLYPHGPIPSRVQISGGAWGMACNAIHFIDMVAWWMNAQVHSVNTDQLAKWTPSKRPGFYEVFGKLHIAYSDGSVLDLSSEQNSDPVIISVEAPGGLWRIDEDTGLATGPNGQRLEGNIPLQSAMTPSLVKQILQTGDCALPTFRESLQQHRPLLAGLLENWNQSQGRLDAAVPIT